MANKNTLEKDIYCMYDRSDGEIFCAFDTEAAALKEVTETGGGTPFQKTKLHFAEPMFTKTEVIKLLKKHLENPAKPGYRRLDILTSIKELEA